MGRRTLLLITSMLIAAIGVGIVGLYVKGADDRATTAAERKYGPPPPTPTATPKATQTNRHADLDHLGITIEVPDPERAVSLLLPGDLVAVYTVTRGGTVPRQPVVASIRVVSVGPVKVVTGAPDGTTVPTTIIGLDADANQAHDIWQAQAKGTLIVAVLGKDPSATPSQ